jgi:hypothetical protein
MSVPLKDSQLATYAPNFATIVSAASATYNMTMTECTALTTLSTGFVTAYNASQVDGMKSKSLTSARRSAKAALLVPLRAYYAQIASMTTVTDQQKVDLGITIRRRPSPTPAPSTEPVTTIDSVRNRTLRIRLRDASNPHRVGRPIGVASAAVLSYVGTAPPTSLSAWKLEGVVSKTLVDVTVPDSVAPGSQVWITAYWLSRKSQSGPASDPIFAFTQIGGVSSEAA